MDDTLGFQLYSRFNARIERFVVSWSFDVTIRMDGCVVRGLSGLDTVFFTLDELDELCE